MHGHLNVKNSERFKKELPPPPTKNNTINIRFRRKQLAHWWPLYKRLFCALSAPIQSNHNPNVQGGPKVVIKYIVNYCISTFGPPVLNRNQ